MSTQLFRTIACGLIFTLNACSEQASPSRTNSASLVTAIQDHIAAADSSAEAYYAKTYRYAEPRYWLRIAGWIAEDAIARRYIAEKPAHTILDLGCGYGTLLAYAATHYGTAGICFDVIPYLQVEVQQRYGISYTKLDIEKEPFPEDLRVDVVLMTEVIEHLNFHPKSTLDKIFAALNPGGSFFISTPDADRGWGRVYEYYQTVDEMPAPDPEAEWIDGHIWQYTKGELLDVLETAGFEIKRIEHSPGAVGLHFNVWATKPTP